MGGALEPPGRGPAPLTSLFLFLCRHLLKPAAWGPLTSPPLLQSSHVRNLSSKANLVTLSDLRGGASYCVAVQTRDKKSQRESSFTSPLCIQTQGERAPLTPDP